MTAKTQPEALRRRWLKNNRVTAAGVVEHRCPRCLAWLAATPENFHRKGGRLHSTCRECTNSIARDYQQRRYVPHPRVAKKSPADASHDLTAAMRGLRRAE